MALKRAIDLSRNVDGLFNIQQLQILEPLIASYVALDLTAEAEKEQQYALRVAETAYGRMDQRMLKPLEQYGRWLEKLGRYTSARLLYARALTIAEQTGGRGTPLAVDPLLGIARSYRLEFVNGTEEAVPAQDNFGNASDLSPAPLDGQRLNADGERALRLALQALDRQKPIESCEARRDAHRAGRLVHERGRHQPRCRRVQGSVERARARRRYVRAVCAAPAGVSPTAVIDEALAAGAGRAEEHFVEARFTVTKDGKTDNVEVAESDASESLQKSVVSAMKKARYSPRFENGEPVETQAVTYRERVLVKAETAGEHGVRSPQSSGG